MLVPLSQSRPPEGSSLEGPEVLSEAVQRALLQHKSQASVARAAALPRCGIVNRQAPSVCYLLCSPVTFM